MQCVGLCRSIVCIPVLRDGKALLSAIVKGNAEAVVEPSERMALDGSDALNDGRQCPRGLNMSKRVGFLPAPFAGGNPQPHWIVNFP